MGVGFTDLAPASTRGCSAVAFAGYFGAGFVEAVGQHGFGVLGGPTIGKHLFESGIAGVQSHQRFSILRPRFEAMLFLAGQDRVQHRGPASLLPRKSQFLRPIA